MIGYHDGPVHVSASPGSGKTALCLGIIPGIISAGGKVIWSCRKMPDPDRSREILAGLSEVDYENISIIHFSNELPKYTNAIISMSRDFSKTDIVILDDWCGSYGRARKEEVESVMRISKSCEATNVVITSSSYEDASGAPGENWISRGGRTVNEAFKTVFLQKHPIKQGVRIFRSNGAEKLLLMTKRGLEEISS